MLRYIVMLILEEILRIDDLQRVLYLCMGQFGNSEKQETKCGLRSATETELRATTHRICEGFRLKILFKGQQVVAKLPIKFYSNIIRML